MERLIRIVKNRFFIGIMCLILSVIVLVVFVPSSAEKEMEEHNVVRFKRQLNSDTKIERDMIELYTVIGNSVTGIDNIENVIGKYTKSVVYAGDFATEDKLTSVANDLSFSEIDDNYVGISVSVSTLALSVSGKLNKGDVVKVFGFDKDSEQVIDEPTLQALEVLTITNKKAVDTDSTTIANMTGTEDIVPDTIMLKAATEQAKKLVELENIGNIHLAFVARGNKAQEILRAVNGGV